MKELRIPINSRIILFEYQCPNCDAEWYTPEPGNKNCPYPFCGEKNIEPNGSFTSFPREIKDSSPRGAEKAQEN